MWEVLVQQDKTGAVPAVRGRQGRRLAASMLRGGVIVATALLLTGCRSTSVGADGVGADGVAADGVGSSPGASYSEGGSVLGSGRLTSLRLPLSDVTALQVGANFVVHVTIGEPEQATIQMDDNLTELVEATVRGGELRLGLKPGASVRNATLSAEVTVRHLDRITTTGVSEVDIDSALTGAELEVDSSGASRVTATVRVDQATASASGTSTLTLSGQVERMTLRAAGTSALRLSELVVDDLEAALSGASCATVTVRDTLAAQAQGVSTLRYLGTPRVIREQTSGISSIGAHASRDGRCG